MNKHDKLPLYCKILRAVFVVVVGCFMILESWIWRNYTILRTKIRML